MESSQRELSNDISTKKLDCWLLNKKLLKVYRDSPRKKVANSESRSVRCGINSGSFYLENKKMKYANREGKSVELVAQTQWTK
jgi:hypothetical protein